MALTDEEVERYSRHILLSDIGGNGQEKIKQGRVLIIGAGGLGCPIGLYLAAAGVGHIGIVDADVVDLSNLQRQIAHRTIDVNRLKVESLKERMLAINPHMDIAVHAVFFSADNAFSLLKNYDFIVDGTDNFSAKFLINDACVIGKKPFSHGGILRFNGQTFTYLPNKGCYRCLFKEPPPKNTVPSCSQAGILGAVAGMLGTTQATEVLKFLTGTGDLLTNRLLVMDTKKMAMRTVAFKKNPDCPVCSEAATITSLVESEQPVCDLKKG